MAFFFNKTKHHSFSTLRTIAQARNSIYSKRQIRYDNSNTCKTIQFKPSAPFQNNSNACTVQFSENNNLNQTLQKSCSCEFCSHNHSEISNLMPAAYGTAVNFEPAIQVNILILIIAADLRLYK